MEPLTLTSVITQGVVAIFNAIQENETSRAEITASVQRDKLLNDLQRQAAQHIADVYQGHLELKGEYIRSLQVVHLELIKQGRHEEASVLERRMTALYDSPIQLPINSALYRLASSS